MVVVEAAGQGGRTSERTLWPRPEKGEGRRDHVAWGEKACQRRGPSGHREDLGSRFVAFPKVSSLRILSCGHRQQAGTPCCFCPFGKPACGLQGLSGALSGMQPLEPLTGVRPAAIFPAG